MDVRWHPGQVQCPAHQAGCACFYAEYVPTHPTPVHSRDAACPRPACSHASRAITHPTCLPASCMLTCVPGYHAPHVLARVLGHHAPHVLVRVLHAHMRPGPSRTPRAWLLPAWVRPACSHTQRALAPHVRPATLGTSRAFPLMPLVGILRDGLPNSRKGTPIGLGNVSSGIGTL